VRIDPTGHADCDDRQNGCDGETDPVSVKDYWVRKAATSGLTLSGRYNINPSSRDIDLIYQAYGHSKKSSVLPENVAGPTRPDSFTSEQRRDVNVRFDRDVIQYRHTQKTTREAPSYRRPDYTVFSISSPGVFGLGPTFAVARDNYGREFYGAGFSFGLSTPLLPTLAGGYVGDINQQHPASEKEVEAALTGGGWSGGLAFGPSVNISEQSSEVGIAIGLGLNVSYMIWWENTGVPRPIPY
jgi:hypothetical protein